MTINTENNICFYSNDFSFFQQDSLPVKKKEKGKQKHKKHSADSLHEKTKKQGSKDSISDKGLNNSEITFSDSTQKEFVADEAIKHKKYKDINVASRQDCFVYKDTAAFSLYDFSFPTQSLNISQAKLIIPFRDSTYSYKYTTGKAVFNFPEKFYSRYPSDWMIVIFILSLVIFGWVYAFFRKHIYTIFQSSYDEKVSFRLREEKNTITERVLFSLNVLFIINLTLFVYEAAVFWGIDILDKTNFTLFGIIAVLLLFIYLFKYLFYHFMGFLLNHTKEVSLFVHNILLYNKILGLILFPVVIIIPFLDDTFIRYFIIFGSILFVISFLFRLFRIFQLSMKINFSGFYLILYLCAVEILPLFLIGKFFHRLINS